MQGQPSSDPSNSYYVPPYTKALTQIVLQSKKYALFMISCSYWREIWTIADPEGGVLCKHNQAQVDPT